MRLGARSVEQRSGSSLRLCCLAFKGLVKLPKP